MDRIKFRYSVMHAPRFKAVWGIHLLPWVSDYADDFMAYAFRIGIKGCDNKVWMKGATHQIGIHALELELVIDFNPKKSMFEQKSLVPSIEPCITWQGKYASDADCIASVSADVQHICSLHVPPYCESEEEWDRKINQFRKNRVPYKILPRATFMKKGKV